MSAPRKDDLARGWSAAERLLDERADRVEAMSDEEFEREMRAQPAPDRVPSVDAIVARAKRIAAERTEPPRDAAPARDAADAAPNVFPIRPRWLWLLAAAVGVLALIAVAIFSRPRAPDPWHPDDRVARAHELRREATAACEENRIAECESKLDDARDLDLEGERAPEVQAARARIAEAIAVDAQAPPREGKPPGR